MIKKVNEYRTYNATQNAMEKFSWWFKWRPVIKTCLTVLKHIVNIIKIIHAIQQLIP